MDLKTVRSSIFRWCGSALRGVAACVFAGLGAGAVVWLLARLFTLPRRDPPLLWMGLLWGMLAGFPWIVARFDAREKHAYLCRMREQEREGRRFSEDIRDTLSVPFYWVETGAFTLCLLLWPALSSNGVALFTAAQPGSSGFRWCQMLALALPFAAVRAMAGAAARRVWFRDLGKYDFDSPPREHTVLWVLREMLLWVLNLILLVLVVSLWQLVGQGLSGIFSSLGAVILLPAVWAIALIALFLWLRAAVKRIRMLRRLRRICREKGCSLTVRRNPYLSILFPGREEDMVVEGEERYPVKLIACRNPLVRLRLQEGIYTFYHKVGFGKMFFYVPVRHRFRFTQEGRRMLVLCPSTPNTAFGDMKTAAPADNGDRLGDAMLFTSTAFCHYLERSL